MNTDTQPDTQPDTQEILDSCVGILMATEPPSEQEGWFYRENDLEFRLELPGFNKDCVRLSIENGNSKVLSIQPRRRPARRFEFPKSDRIIYDSSFAEMKDGVLTVFFELESKIKHIKIN